MKTSILTRLAFGLGAVAATSGLVIATLTGPANADTGTIDYTLTTDDPTREGRLVGSFDPCLQAVVEGPRHYRLATLTVSEDGDYTFSDRRFQGEGEGLEDAFVAVYEPDGDPLSNSIVDCVATYDDVPGPTSLQAGVTYRLLLTSRIMLETGSFSYSYEGPGSVTLTIDGDGVTFEQAQAACEPGGEIPAGFELREGTSRNDTVRGTSGNDVLRGLGGNDTLVGLGGDDILCGGAGNDSLQGGQGEDFLFGGAGNDDLAGGADDDVLAGAAGNDLLDGGAGTDVGLDTQGSNTFRSIESRTLEPTPGPDPSPSPTIFTAR